MARNQFENYQKFLDEVQYSKNGVQRYEWIFGEGYLSTGGLETTKEIVPLLQLKEGDRVLDVGCGLGGHDFYMAENYGAIIDAIDLSKNMMEVALRHFENRPHISGKIKFQICDVMTTPFADNSYDVIYSRDALLHIKQKPELFRKFYSWLKPGGRIVFTDYARGEKKASEEFVRYVRQRDYDLYTVGQYEELMKSEGFVNVVAEDINNKFIDSLNRELKKLYINRKEFLELFNQEDYDALEKGWQDKVKRAKDGYQSWGLFHGQRPNV